MSWSKSLSGTVAEIRDQMAKVGAEVEATDRSYAGTNEALIAAHQRQVKDACNIVEHGLTLLPEGYAASAHINGHAGTNADGELTSDSASAQVSIYKPAA